jgi:hypothetical protein
MVDVESVGFIVEIGACYFDMEGNIGEQFIEGITMQSCVEHGCKFNHKELLFWLKREGVPTWTKNPMSITQALRKFREFCRRDAIVYSHGYDLRRMEEIYAAIGERIPFSYRNHMDIRTIVALSGLKTKKEGAGDPKTHNALDDAVYQVGYIVPCLKELGRRTTEGGVKE